MGQGQSSSDNGDAALTYHPSAVGYSLSKGSQNNIVNNYDFLHDNGKEQQQQQKKSVAGPIRNRVKGKQSIASTIVDDRIPSQSNEEVLKSSHPVPEQTRTVTVREKNDSPLQAGLSPSSPSSSSFTASPNLSSRGEFRISVAPGHPSIVEMPEPEVTESPTKATSTTTVPVPKLLLPPEESNHLENSDHGHTPEPVPAPLADALKSGLGKVFLLPVEEGSTSVNAHHQSVSREGEGSTHTRRGTDETNRETLLAYWDRMETESLQRRSMQSNGCGEKSIRRHSWNSSRHQEEGSEPSISRGPSPYRTVAGRWTSQWEDRRGLGISEEEERIPSQTHFQWSSDEMPGSESRSSPSIASKRVVKRKPVPPEEESDYLDSSTKSTPVEVGKQYILWPATAITPTVNDNDREDLISKRSSHVSRASATTEALHSHVEKIRAGPSYQIDRSASTLFIPTETAIQSNSNSNIATTNNPSTTVIQSTTPDSPARKRPRALSLMAKIKGRVRKNSDATILSSPYTASPSTPGMPITAPPTPMTPAQTLTDQVLKSSDSVQKMMTSPSLAQSPPIHSSSSKSLYAMARRPSRKLSTTRNVEAAEIESNPATLTAKKVARLSNDSLNRRSSRQSIRSVNSAKSIRSKRSSNASLRNLEQRKVSNTVDSAILSNKQRSNSHPLPTQQQWWKNHVVWPRRGSAAGLLTKDQRKDEEDTAWVDEEVNAIEDDRGIQSPVAQPVQRSKALEKSKYGWSPKRKAISIVSPIEVELSARRNDASSSRVGPSRKTSPPLVLVGRDQIETSQQQQQRDDIYGYGTIRPSPSTSTFSSLAPPPAPAPVPPPRPSRKTKRRDSSSNGGDSSSAPSPLLSSGGKEGVEMEAAGSKNASTTGRFSPLNLGGDSEPKVVAGMAAFAPFMSPTHSTSPTPDSIRNSKTVSDAGTKEILLSEDSEDQMEPPKSKTVLQGDEGDYNATVQPYLDSLAESGLNTKGSHLSPVMEIRRREILPFEEDEEEEGGAGEDDAFTVTERSSNGTHHRIPSLAQSERGASMGVTSNLLEESSSSPRKRPLPAPPVLAEPATNLQSVTRSNSIGSSQAGSTLGGQTSVASMKKHTAEGQQQTMIRRPLPPTPSNNNSNNFGNNVRPNRSVSMPPKPTPFFPRATHEIVQAADADHSHKGNLQQESEKRNSSSKIRESWTSADGPWHADVVALPSTSTFYSLPRGLARAAVEPKDRLLRQRSSSSPLNVQMLKAGDWTEIKDSIASSSNEAIATDPVPFAETAVQASLAALEAIERSEQYGDDWRSRWAREKLLGSSAAANPKHSTKSSKKMDVAPPTLHVQPSISEMSDYSNSRTRRRAAPYSRTRDQNNSSSADEKARRTARKRKDETNRRLNSSSASYIARTLTSDSDHAVYDHHLQEYGSTLGGASSLRETLKPGTWGAKSSMSNEAFQRRGSNPTMQRGKIPSAFTTAASATSTAIAPAAAATSPQSGGPTLQKEEDWDEKIVPALAKRLEVEAEEEAKMMKRRSSQTPSSPALLNDEPSLQRSESGFLDPMVGQQSSNDIYWKGRDEENSATSQRKRERRRRASESKRKTSSKYARAAEEEKGGRGGEGEEDSDDAKTSRSRRTRRTSERERKKQPSSTTSTTRLPKVRKGYGGDDIRAWQASLAVAAPPTTTLVE